MSAVVTVGGILVSVRFPRTYRPVSVTRAGLFSAGAAPLVAAMFGGSTDDWALGLAVAAHLGATSWLWAATTGSLMQSVERLNAFSGSVRITADTDVDQVVVEPMMDILRRGGPPVVVPRKRPLDVGARRAIVPAPVRSAASMSFGRAILIRYAALLLLGFSVMIGVTFGSKTLAAAAITATTIAVLALHAMQTRVVYGGLIELPNGRRVLHIVDPFRPQFIGQPDDLETICRDDTGKPTFIAYRSDAALPGRLLLMRAPRGGGSKTVPRTTTADSRRMTLLGLAPKVRGRIQQAHRADGAR